MELLNRDEFRQSILKRDNYSCVICKEPAQDAHHIIERRLFHDGGYYLDNGASLCGKHHIEAETTALSCNKIRRKANIQKIVLPEHLYKDQEYDKWGNIILPNGLRLKGELFFDESVQKILKQGDVLKFFTKYIKYPRTFHLPWSKSIGRDDKQMESTKEFWGKRAIVSVKMDGENTTMYNNHIHARSIDSRNHPSRNWVKNYHSKIKNDIPEDWRICGENLYAKHSIHYSDLDSYFYGFSIWNEKNVCLSWDETLEWFQLLDIHPVQIIYDDIYNAEKIKSCWKQLIKLADNNHEGYVIRTADEIRYRDFKQCVGKYVIPDRIETHGHWMRSRLIKNIL